MLCILLLITLPIYQNVLQNRLQARSERLDIQKTESIEGEADIRKFVKYYQHI